MDLGPRGTWFGVEELDQERELVARPDPRPEQLAAAAAGPGRGSVGPPSGGPSLTPADGRRDGRRPPSSRRSGAPAAQGLGEHGPEPPGPPRSIPSVSARSARGWRAAPAGITTTLGETRGERARSALRPLCNGSGRAMSHPSRPGFVTVFRAGQGRVGLVVNSPFCRNAPRPTRPSPRGPRAARRIKGSRPRGTAVRDPRLLSASAPLESIGAPFGRLLRVVPFHAYRQRSLHRRTIDGLDELRRSHRGASRPPDPGLARALMGGRRPDVHPGGEPGPADHEERCRRPAQTALDALLQRPGPRARAEESKKHSAVTPPVEAIIPAENFGRRIGASSPRKLDLPTAETAQG